VNALATLLPPNSTPIELALEQTSAARRPLPAHLVSDVWSPDACPAHLLGFLAWGLSIDLWDEKWPEAKKRQVCRKALELHQLKTTIAGIKAHVELVDAQVLKAVRPPARAHLQSSMTAAGRAAWLDSLPQVRIYPFFRRAFHRPRHAFLSAGARRQFLGSANPPVELGVLDGSSGLPLGGRSSNGTINDSARVFLLGSRGFDLYRRRATYFDNGVEVPATLSIAADGVTERVAIRRLKGRRPFVGAMHLKGSHLLKSEADQSLLSLQLADDAPLKPVIGGAKPVSVRPQRIARRRTAPIGQAFLGRWRLGSNRSGHLSRSFAPNLIYDRIAFAVPGRLGQRLKASAFVGHFRLGVRPFTAELTIKVPMRRPARAFRGQLGRGFLWAADMTPLTRALEAVRVSKALRDTVLVKTTTTRLAAFDSSLRFGEFNFGSMRKAV
jgi:phage tail P2-like protein